MWEYDQNTLFKIPKELIKMRKSQQNMKADKTQKETMPCMILGQSIL